MLVDKILSQPPVSLIDTINSIDFFTLHIFWHNNLCGQNHSQICDNIYYANSITCLTPFSSLLFFLCSLFTYSLHSIQYLHYLHSLHSLPLFFSFLLFSSVFFSFLLFLKVFIFYLFQLNEHSTRGSCNTVYQGC